MALKLAVVCPYDLSLSGGVQNIVLEMHRQMLSRGVKVTIISVQPERRVNIPNTAYFGKATPLEWNGAMASFNFGSLATGKETGSFLRKQKFDSIVIHEPIVPFLNWEVMNFPGSKKIGWFHSTTVINPWKFPANFVIEPVQDWLKSKLSGSIAISTSAKTVWRKVMGRSGVIISGGVDTNKYSESAAADLGDADKIKILFVGRLDARKGILELVEAVGKMKYKNVRLWVVGNGPQLDESWNLVHKLKLGGRVRFVGRVGDADLPGYFKAADIYCAPSTGGESLGLVLLEAMAAGTPIVAYANPGYRYTLGGYPWGKGLVPVGSTAKLAQALDELCEKADLRAQLSEWEVQRSRAFDWRVMTDKFLEYAEKVRKNNLV